MTEQCAKFVLASSSPRRLALLKQIGVIPDAVDAADIDETPKRGERPELLAKRLSQDKAVMVAFRHKGCWVLGADTVVACGLRILPKTNTLDEARKCLALLSGRRHRVFSGLCIVDPAGSRHCRCVRSTVTFKRLHDRDLEDYLRSGEWRGKAGGYAIQGCAARYIRAISGSYSNVVGLPLFETWSLLEGLGHHSDTAPSGTS